ncbi:MAG: GIY-YIG nuclease family protein [Saprospiraceae bacterium]|nr:GIY-YIG nuclease family protein [Saprospiraceae bacterium]MBK7437571.1 GIY-YIG nuclease family protein [Saprospiraceae bacterium]
MSTKYAVIDIETTGGLPRRDRIIEIGIILYDGEKELDRFESLIDPGISIPPQITRLTGIHSGMVEAAPKFFEVAKQIVELTEGAIFVAHNVRFDYNFIREEFSRLGYTFTRKQLCTKRLARKSIEGLRSYSLESLINHFNIKVTHRHRALDDAYAASVVLDHVLRRKENLSMAFDMIHQGVKESRLPASLSLDYLHSLPEECGIYYFHNAKGDIIYVGKSINIKDRILQHFADHTEKSTALHQQVDSITYEITGSELLALLRENEEIKKLKPEINRQLRKKTLPIGVYSYLDENGYIRFITSKIENADSEYTLVKKFSTPANAKSFLAANVERYQLCLKLTGIEKDGGACFDHHIGKCPGACIGEEYHYTYNLRAGQLLGTPGYLAETFVINEAGRNYEEHTLLYVQNGKCVGYYFKSDYDQIPLDTNDFNSILSDDDACMILKNYLTKKKGIKKTKPALV